MRVSVRTRRDFPIALTKQSPQTGVSKPLISKSLMLRCFKTRSWETRDVLCPRLSTLQPPSEPPGHFSESTPEQERARGWSRVGKVRPATPPHLLQNIGANSNDTTTTTLRTNKHKHLRRAGLILFTSFYILRVRCGPPIDYLRASMRGW